MKHIVTTAGMKIGKKGDVLMTYALGSCLGLMLYDPEVCIGGMLHAMLPSSKINLEKAKENPFMFVDTGVPEMLSQLTDAGVKKTRLVIKVAGCASPLGGSKSFDVAKRNYAVLEQVFFKNNIQVDARAIGGTDNLTVLFNVSTGSISIKNKGEENPL